MHDGSSRYGQSVPYHNLMAWAWEGLTGYDHSNEHWDGAKTEADIRAAAEVARFGGHVRHGGTGALVFPDKASMVEFLMAWG